MKNILRVLNIRYIRENYKRLPFLLMRTIIFEPAAATYFFLARFFYPLRRWANIVDVKDIHKGEDIFVIGNGPSLASLNLEDLNSKITLASNKIFLSFDTTNWRPTYYTVEDDLVLKQNLDNIKAVNSRKLFPITSLFYVGRISGVNYYNFKQKHHFPNLPEFGTGIYSGVYWGSSVVYSQIQLAAIMGARRIILLGVDFSFTIPTRSVESTKEIVSEGERNHFHEDYRAPGEVWNVPSLDKQRLAFEAARIYCSRIGIQVVNATTNTALDVFEKVSLGDILFQREFASNTNPDGTD